MPIQIIMPALSPTMTEGGLAKWLKKEGDAVVAGDVLAEIETDKATMEVEAVDEGILGRILIAEGTDGVPVNTPIALLLEDGEDASVLDAAAVSPAPAPAAPAQPAAAPQPPAATPALSGNGKAGNGKATPLAARMAAQAGLDVALLPASAPGGKVGKADVLAALGGAPVATQPAAPSPAGGRTIASPLARSMAAQAGIDLAAVAGSGPGGRVVKADIEAALTGGVAAPTRATATATPAPAEPGTVPDRSRAFEEIPHSNVRKIIAKRLTEADRDIPHIYLTVDCDIGRLLSARKEINEAAGDAYKVSVNDMLIKASALALRKVPGANAQWTEGAVRMMSAVDVSVAVAFDGGLITPIIFDADKKGLGTIAPEMKYLAARARDGKLMPEEFQGGTFTISNLGMFGISHFTSIINPPQACILAVGAGEERVVVRDGEIGVATMMSCTLSCDHRVVDGALGAQWLQAFKGFVERPATMLA